MANSVMTMRDFLNAVINGTVDENAVEFAEAKLVQMDAANEKRREKAAEKNTARAEMFAKLVGVLTDTPKTASTLVEELEGVIVREDGKALNPQFISRLAKVGVDEGTIAKVSVKVEGAKGSKVGYKLA